MKSGLAIAGAIALAKASSAAPSKVQPDTRRPAPDSSLEGLSARRLRPVKGTVRYES